MKIADRDLLAAEPGDALFEVWADELSEAGDPRGELVTLCRRAADDPAAKAALEALVAAHTREWCPGCISPHVHLTWRDGFVDAIELHPGDEIDSDLGYEGGEGEDDERVDDEADLPRLGAGGAILRLVDLPTAARTSRISVDCPLTAEGNHGCWGSHDAFLARLLARDRPRLRALELDGGRLPGGSLSFLTFGVMHDAEVTIGDLSALWARAPRLERLVVAQPRTPLALGAIDAPNLRELILGGAPTGELARGRMPALETLAVRVADAEGVRALLANPTLRALRDLSLVCTPRADGQPRDDVIDVIVDSPIARQLARLDLGGLDASPDAWDRLAAAAARFPNLKSLALTTWEIDPTVAETDDWLFDVVEELEDARFSPRRLPAGERLARALPVHWMRASIYSVVSDSAPPAGTHLGFYQGMEGFAEQR